MKLRLKKGKQKELMLLAKGGLNWAEFGRLLGISSNYLSGDLKMENILISRKLYTNLCKLAKVDFEQYILEVLPDNWGRSKGGLNSSGSTIKLKKPSFSQELAEFVGAVLGDGHVHFTKGTSKKRKIGVYQIKIAGDLKLDREYHEHLSNLSKSLFELNPSFIINKKMNERFLCLSSKELVEFFMGMGIKPGNKIVNQSTIPKWVYRDKLYLKSCVRGLIDTDGCIHRMSKRDFSLLRINFKNHDYRLLRDIHRAFVLLGFHPSKIIRNNVFYISRQKEIEKYLKEIGFSNKRHLDRLNKFRSPVV